MVREPLQSYFIECLLLALLIAFCATSAATESNPYAAESAIYKIEVPNGSSVGLGTGVLISRNKIITNCHVVKKAGWPVVTHRKTGQKFRPVQYYNLGNHDACILVGIFTGTPVLITDDFSIGENVWHYGYPRGVSSMGQGVIKAVLQTDHGLTIQSAAFCNPGSSGGPLLNIRGELIGLNFGVFGKYGDQCLSIPVKVLRPFLNN